MEKEQVKELLTLIKNAYPRFLPDEKEKAISKVEMWNSFMKKWDYEKAKAKLITHIENSPYEPKISEVKPTDKYKPDYSWKEGLYD